MQKNKKINPDEDSILEIIAKMQKALKPLGYEIHGFSEGHSLRCISLNLEYEHHFVPV
jgi:hypothetical protein